jgi:hypothetical protein
MTSPEINLAQLIRAISKITVHEALAQQRTHKTLSGTVEQLDEELDVAYIRMDDEATSGDPAESSNFEAPGVIPATRLGEAFDDETVRVTFDGYAGASATRTSSQNRIVLPFGAEDGRRIVFDGNDGVIAFYNDDGALVGYLDSETWAIGEDLGSPGNAVTLDPLGGLRIRGEGDTLVSIMDQNGYTLRDVDTGIVTAEIQPGRLRLVDPSGVDDIEMVTSSAGTLPNPSYSRVAVPNPGSTLLFPASMVFTTTPADDIEIAHVAAWRQGTNQAATMTPPAGWTERQDGNHPSASGTLQTSIASRRPATGTSGGFASTQSNWHHSIGSHIVIKGGDGTSPTFRSMTETSVEASGALLVLTGAKPSGVVAGDVLLAFISMGVAGGLVPTGWVTPEGFVFLGADHSTSGSGSTQSTLATGVWAKLCTASEPANYQTSINLPTGTKFVQGTLVAIEGAFLVPGGVQIRMAGKPTRRILDYVELQTASTTLCDFQNIPASYDNLELVYDVVSAVGHTAPRVIRLRINNVTTNTRYYSNVANHTNNTSTLFFQNQPDLILGSLGRGVGATATGSIDLYGYGKTTARHKTMARAFYLDSLQLMDESCVGLFDAVPSGPINRLTVITNGPITFGVGSKAFLYGY